MFGTKMVDRVLVNAIDCVISRVLGVDPKTTEPAPKTKGKGKAKPAPTTPAPKVNEPAPTTEDTLSGLGEKYGPMLLRRARAVAKHALNGHGALAVIVAWAETAEPTEVVGTLRGSEKLPVEA